MKRTIEFKFGTCSLSVSGIDMFCPRIGEKIDIYNLIENPQERIDYNNFRNNEVLFVMDICHVISQNEQVIEVTLLNDLDFKNDFYNSICT